MEVSLTHSSLYVTKVPSYETFSPLQFNKYLSERPSEHIYKREG